MVSRSINWIDYKLYLRSDLVEALEYLDNGGNEWLYAHPIRENTNQERQWLDINVIVTSLQRGRTF